MKVVVGLFTFFVALGLILSALRALPAVLSGQAVAILPGGDKIVAIPCPQGGPAAALCTRVAAVLGLLGQVAILAALLSLARRAFR